MATKFEVGTWTGNNTSPQTISLADSSLTPIAIIVTTIASGVPGSGIVPNQVFSMGFGTRRGGATQSGCVGIWSSDNVATGSTGRTRDTTLLKVLSAETTTDYTVSLSSFAAGQFVVTYSSAANANRDQFQYWVFGGDDLTDAIVINETMDGTTTQSITGAGFQPDVLFALDADLTGTTNTSNLALGFGCASSPTQFWTQCITETDADTMASTQNWNKQNNISNCLARLTINADTQSALWDLDSFDSDGATLGVNDAPPATTSICTFLFIKGGSWEAGQKAKGTDIPGDDTFTLTNSNLVVRGIILGNTDAISNDISTGSCVFILGAGSTPNTTRGNAVNNCVASVGGEGFPTDVDRYRATDLVTAIIRDTPTTEDNEAWYDTAGTGSFIIEWAGTTSSATLINYLAIGDSPAAPPASRNLALMGIGQ
jgi:hypothetical protein